MPIADALRLELDARIRASLLPARFPERRDLDLAFSVSCADPGASLVDYVWIDEFRLFATALHLTLDGLEGALETAALRQLLRALAAGEQSPERIVRHLSETARLAPADLVCIVFDTRTGALCLARTGRALAHLSDGAIEAGDHILAPGDMLWLSIGDGPASTESIATGASLQNEVDAMRMRISGASVLGALHYKSIPKARDTATFIVPNRRSAIPPFLEAARRFFAHHGLSEADAAGLEIALDEILTNQVTYGYRDGSRREILAWMRVEPGLLSVEVRDDGEPFNPLDVGKPNLTADLEDRQIGGLGMHFVVNLLDSVTYRRKEGWNVLALEKRLSDRDPEREA